MEVVGSNLRVCGIVGSGVGTGGLCEAMLPETERKVFASQGL